MMLDNLGRSCECRYFSSSPKKFRRSTEISGDMTSPVFCSITQRSRQCRQMTSLVFCSITQRSRQCRQMTSLVFCSITQRSRQCRQIKMLRRKQIEDLISINNISTHFKVGKYLQIFWYSVINY